MQWALRHKWSLLSGLITLAHCAVIIGVISYLYERGTWEPDAYPRPPIVSTLAYVHISGILLSAGFALKGLMAETSPIYAAMAFTLSLGSYLIYVG